MTLQPPSKLTVEDVWRHNQELERRLNETRGMLEELITQTGFDLLIDPKVMPPKRLAEILDAGAEARRQINRTPWRIIASPNFNDTIGYSLSDGVFICALMQGMSQDRAEGFAKYLNECYTAQAKTKETLP